MTVCLVTIPQAPTLSIAPAVDPCQFVQSHYDVKHGWILQKSEWLPFFPSYILVYLSGSQHI